MKKIMIILSLIIFFIIKENVYAQTYNLYLDRQEGIYYARIGGDLPYYTSQFIIYRVGNEIAYCIEPSKNITTFSYVDTDGNINLPYSDDVKRKIQLIGYYGREYEGHDNVRYSMAAQSLIWNITSNQEIIFYTGPNETGEIIDVTREKEEIMNLVNNYQELNIPREIYGEYNSLIEFKDNNLRNYYISDDGGNNEFGRILLEDNKLKIYSKIIGNSYIELSRKTYDDKSTLIFVGNNVNNSQTLGRLRLPENPIRLSLNINGIKIRINKIDEEHNLIKIPGIKFKIKNLDTNDYVCEEISCIYETNSEGFFYTKGLPLGSYEIEEVKELIPGYVYNNEKMTITITRDMPIFWTKQTGHYVKLDFVNKKILGELNVYKKQEKYNVINEELNYYMEDGIGIKFNLFNDQNELIGELITDNEGKASISNLPMGNYYLEEIMPENYQNNNKIFFSLEQSDPEMEIVSFNTEVNNYLQKGNLKIIKVDKDNKEPISNTFFDLYYNDKYLFTKETDANGEINLDSLPCGNYYLQESIPNVNYQILNEKKFFDIKENEILELVIENEKITIEVPETLDNTSISVNLSFIWTLLWYIYEKKH